jgi:hypothetical protein
MNESQSTKPEVNMARTVVFFDQLISQKPGAEEGSVQLRENGILLHPGEKESTEVIFDLAGEKDAITLAAWIALLPQEALANEQAGVAAIQLFLNDKPLPRVEVTRHSNLFFTFDASGASKLKIVADSANGTALFDWLFIGLM